MKRLLIILICLTCPAVSGCQTIMGALVDSIGGDHRTNREKQEDFLDDGEREMGWE